MNEQANLNNISLNNISTTKNSKNTKFSSILRTIGFFLIITLAVFNYINRAILVPNSRYILMDLLGYSAEQANANTRMITTLHTLFKWIAAAFTIVYGYLNDRYPRKWILGAGITIYGICAIATAYVTSYSQLVTMQMLTAVAIGASLPTSYSILSDMYPPKNRGKVFGIFGLATIFGDIFGNLMVSVIFPATPENISNWRQPFYYSGLVSLIATILLLIIVKEPKRGGSEEALKDILSNESINYAYRIKFGDLKEVWVNKTNRWLIFNFIDNLMGGYILATAIDWLRTEHNAAPEVAGMLVLIPALAIIAGTVFWGFVGDYWFKKDLAGRVKVAALCLFMSALIIPFAVTRPFDLDGLDLGQTLANPQFQFAFALFFVFFFFNNGVGPAWYSTLMDANKIEVRGSMLSVATFFEEFGEGLGILIGGIIHDILASNGSTAPFGTTYLYLALTLVLGVSMWIPMIKTSRVDIAHVNELNKQRAEELKKKLMEQKTD